MRTVWYNADDKRIRLETHPPNLIRPNSSLQIFLKIHNSFSSLSRKLGSQTKINVSISNLTSTWSRLQRTKQISKRVKRERGCWTQTVSLTFKRHEGTRNTADSSGLSNRALGSEKSSQSKDHLYTPVSLMSQMFDCTSERWENQPYNYIEINHVYIYILKKKANKEDFGAKMVSWWGTVPRSLISPFKST